MSEFERLMGVELALRWHIEREGPTISLTNLGLSSQLVPRPFYLAQQQGVASGELSFAFSAFAPEPAQRNRPIVVPGARRILAFTKSELERLGKDEIGTPLQRLIELHDRYGIADHYQLRVVLCDGALALDYVNTVQRTPFTRRQQRAFDAAVRLIRKRSLIDLRISEATLYRQRSLDAALEAIGRAAYLTDSKGRDSCEQTWCDDH